MLKSNRAMKIFGIAFTMIFLMIAGMAMAAVPDSHDDCQHESCVCLCHIFVSLSPEADTFNINATGFILEPCSDIYSASFSNDIFRPPVA